MPKSTFVFAKFFLLLASISLFQTQLLANNFQDSEKSNFFESKIRPVLVERCYECHNSVDRAEGDLALDYKKATLKGGSEGPAVVPGKPNESLLIKAIRHEIESLRMPEDNPKLSKEIVANFEKWIRDGAFDPRDKKPTAEEISKATSWEAIREKRKKWWSFQPVANPKIPIAKKRKLVKAPNRQLHPF